MKLNIPINEGLCYSICNVQDEKLNGTNEDKF